MTYLVSSIPKLVFGDGSKIPHQVSRVQTATMSSTGGGTTRTATAVPQVYAQPNLLKHNSQVVSSSCRRRQTNIEKGREKNMTQAANSMNSSISNLNHLHNANNTGSMTSILQYSSRNAIDMNVMTQQ